MKLWKKIAKLLNPLDENYIKAKNVFKYILCYPSLPNEIIKNIKKSAELSIQEQRERYDLYAFGETESYIFQTEALEDLGAIKYRKKSEIKIENRKAMELLLPYRVNGLKVLEHHTHVYYSIPSIEDLLNARNRDWLDIAAISLPMLNYITQLYFDVKKLRELNEGDLVQALNKLEFEFCFGSRKWGELLF